MVLLGGCDFMEHLFSEFGCRADLFSESQRIKYTIQQRTQDIPDARTYLLTLQEIRVKYVVCFLNISPRKFFFYLIALCSL